MVDELEQAGNFYDKISLISVLLSNLRKLKSHVQLTNQISGDIHVKWIREHYCAPLTGKLCKLTFLVTHKQTNAMECLYMHNAHRLGNKN